MNGIANNLGFRCKPANAGVKALRLATLDTTELLDAAVIFRVVLAYPAYWIHHSSSISRSLLAQYSMSPSGASILKTLTKP
jgi:hypothetical protein